MNQRTSHTPPTARAVPVENFRADLREIARRQWWLWSSAILVTLLLTLAVASFAFPGLLAQAEASSSFFLDQAVRGLVGLVLLFNINAVYQQLQINRIRRQLGEQLDALGKMDERTQEVYKLAVLDPLTGLYNRRCGEQRLGEEMLRAKRYARPLALVMLDLDGLKSINDKYGHPAGDEMLKDFATRLTKAIRGSDVAVRLGGDEFMILLPECKPEEVRLILGRLSGPRIELKGQPESLSFSFGWAAYVPGEEAQELVNRADAALYVNKRATKTQS